MYGKWKKLGSFFMESNATNKVAHAFLATDLEMCDTDFDDDENIEIEWIPLEEAVEKVLNGEIKNGLSSLGIVTALAHLQKTE
jgi:ADP-ribose pyrophosphatase